MSTQLPTSSNINISSEILCEMFIDIFNELLVDRYDSQSMGERYPGNELFEIQEDIEDNKSNLWGLVNIARDHFNFSDSDLLEIILTCFD